MASPRPILKRPSASFDLPHPHPPHVVHFPPSCSLACTFAAHSAATYDRSPIVVAPNSCALPERGCPGRTYGLGDDDGSDNCLYRQRPPPPTNLYRPSNTPIPHPRNGRDLHPRALGLKPSSSSTSTSSPQPPPLLALPYRKNLNDGYDDPQRTPTLAYPGLPPLIPDFSSESEESDGATYTPIDTLDPYTDAVTRMNQLSFAVDTSLSISRPYSSSASSITLGPCKYTAYAAYSVSTMSSTCGPNNPPRVPPPLSFAALSASEDEGSHYRPPRPRNRRRDRSRSRERTRNDTPSDSFASPPLPVSPSSPKRSPLGSRRLGGGSRLSGGTQKTSSAAFASYDQDSGCLGGF